MGVLASALVAPIGTSKAARAAANGAFLRFGIGAPDHITTADPLHFRAYASAGVIPAEPAIQPDNLAGLPGFRPHARARTAEPIGRDLARTHAAVPIIADCRTCILSDLVQTAAGSYRGLRRARTGARDRRDHRWRSQPLGNLRVRPGRQGARMRRRKGSPRTELFCCSYSPRTR
jgi:hypothetical protein